jgi:radical SAM superfamily enzyme YgiQ (UPF0313 family)
MDILFADLTHTCNSVPYGIALVAAYAMENVGPEIAVRLFKEPAELAARLKEYEPGMVCFSTYVWNAEISCAFAGRIKERYPGCIIVFGGPHFPLEAASQLAYLENHPEIDFYVHREGEVAFLHLYRALKVCGFSAKNLKSQGVRVPGCYYYHDRFLVAGSPLPPADRLESLPSPYLAGLCDRFLEQGHPVIMQTARGCPFSCSYCQEGAEYFNSVRRYSVDRIERELEYVAARATAATLMLADSNFGMYADDIPTANALAGVQKKYGFPEMVLSISGKNNKQNVLKTAAAITGGMFSAAIQSSDPVVLENIHRNNVSIDELIELATEQDIHHAHSFSEIIVALPGDTVASHCRSAADLMDAGIHVVRSHQLIMLPGSEIATEESRARYGLQTRFRVIHNTVNSYSLFGHVFHAPEVDEICVASNTLSFQGYLNCRHFDLTVEIFYNNGVFSELQAFLKQKGIPASLFIVQLDRRVGDAPLLLARLYADFIVDTQELWQSREELDQFLQQPGVWERYQNGELGINEQLAYKALALFDRMDELVAQAYGVAVDLLQQSGQMDQLVADYLEQLMRFDLCRKRNPMLSGDDRTALFHYDFCGLGDSGFKGEPWEYRLSTEMPILFSHSGKHHQLVAAAGDLLKAGLAGYAALLSKNANIREFFRDASRVEHTL